MSEHNFDADHKAFLDSLLIGMPGVKASKAFGYPAYKVNGKIFAFVGGSGVVVKLPRPRVLGLIGTQPEMQPFEVADGVVWKEWLSIQRTTSEDYAQDLGLFEESVEFVLEH
jgi:hypothetical protein